MKLFLLVLLPLLAHSFSPECLDDNGNPVSSEPFAIENNCDAFYQCSGGYISTQNCAPGTVFNPELSVCDFASNVPGCDQNTIVACENKPAFATCPPGHVIVVKDGFYGRDDGETCPHKSIKTDNCSAEESEDKLKETCDQKTTCQINPTNGVFGDPCFGTYKYVKMNFYCRKQSKTKHKEVICEYKSKTISCPESQVIWVKNAFYGRDDRETCLSFLMRDTSCSADSALEKIRESCNGKSSCTIKSHNSVFGDPCFGTKKYVEMVYKCRPARLATETMCEGDSKTLSCGEGQVIVVKEGFYGRTDATTCPHPSIKNTDCGSEDSFKILRSTCHGKNSCTVSASNAVFGDPCVGTYKYVQMSYKCRNKKEACVDSEGNPTSGAPFENPNDCSTYNQCVHGELMERPCAPGTGFNPEIGVCDWPSNIPGCSLD